MGTPNSRTQQVLDWVWRKRVTTFDAMSNLPPALKNLLAENFRFHTPEIVEIHGSADTTRKFLTRMEDGSLVESVIIPAAAAENGEKIGARHPLRFFPGRLCLRLQILRFRAAGP